MKKKIMSLFLIATMVISMAACSTDEPVKVIATGGLATLIDNGVDCIDHVDKMLTLEGLELIYKKNKKK